MKKSTKSLYLVHNDIVAPIKIPSDGGGKNLIKLYAEPRAMLLEGLLKTCKEAGTALKEIITEL